MKIAKKIAAMLLAVIMTISLAACGGHTALTTEQFTEAIEAKGFTVYDVTVFSQTTITADTVLTALNEEYEIEFYELHNSSDAKSLFALNCDAFEKASTPESEVVSSGEVANHGYYHMANSSDFCMTAYNGNTLIYCYTDADYKDEIIEIVKELGYK